MEMVQIRPYLSNFPWNEVATYTRFSNYQIQNDTAKTNYKTPHYNPYNLIATTVKYLLKIQLHKLLNKDFIVMAFIHQLLRLFLFSLFLVSQAISRPLDPRTSSSLTMRERHEQWMARHGRVYQSIDEKEIRFRIFKENVKRIEEFNGARANKSYTLAPNAFSDMSNEEFVATHTGLSHHTQSSNSSTTIFSNDNPTNTLPSVDWRQQGAVTPVKYQGQCGCCWAFSSVAALEGIYKIKDGNLVSFSEQDLLDCVERNQGCGGGYMTNAYDYVQSQGIETEQDYPYSGNQGQCMAVQAAVKISGYQTITPGDTNSLMAAVNQQPVSIGIDGSGDSFQHYSGGVYNEGCSSNQDHAVTVVGYGTDDSSGLNYWLIKNSWGTTWGENGYMRLLMDENACPVTLLASFPDM